MTGWQQVYAAFRSSGLNKSTFWGGVRNLDLMILS